MDRITHYRTEIRRIINEYAALFPKDTDAQAEIIFDEANDHYELMYVGWKNRRRIHGCILHIDIRNDKIYIQHDGTEDGVALELEQAGIPKDQIVLAFHSPSKRPLTGYAVA